MSKVYMVRWSTWGADGITLKVYAREWQADWVAYTEALCDNGDVPPSYSVGAQEWMTSDDVFYYVQPLDMVS